MADPDRDYRIGRKLPRHYYQPAERIELVPGVTRKELNEWADLYAGAAEDLERAGVLRADMLPAPGHIQITWNPIGVRQGDYGFAPGHLEIRRHHDGTYRAKLTVSNAERKRREQLMQQRAREWQEKRRAQDGDRINARAPVETLTPEKLRGVSKEKTADDFRAFCLRLCDASWWLDGGDGRYEFRFSDDVRRRIEGLEAEIHTLIEHGSVLPLRPAAPAGSGHLRLAWSAQGKANVRHG